MSRSTPRPDPRHLDDALTNPLYAVRVLPNGQLDHRRAAKAADEAAKAAAARRTERR